ncbi:MAG TPA: SLC13 family permease [Bacilli bacterium]|nr:MAG: Citrate transporter [Tenericutes bacterium ADurb.BinA124]HNZ50622.1 SLC13 family permease [Bacilli bacterium]HPX83861.1 SLC13 family permease [Bacilli bacterium]
MVLALILFACTYVLLLALPKYRAYVALTSAAVFIILGIIPLNKVLGAIDWNVIMMIFGTMGVVGLFIESKMPSRLADFIIAKMPNVKWTIFILALFAGLISAFIDNVATVLMIAPVALNIAKKLEISPVGMVIAIAVSSNLQGAATLVGDTTSILLGGEANMNFLDFFFFKGKVGIFWVVQAGALVSALILLWIFRKETAKVEEVQKTEVKDYFPTVLLLGVIVLLIIASFFPKLSAATGGLINGIICVSLFIVGITRKIIVKREIKPFVEALKEIDYTTLLLLIGLFVVIGGITEAGVIDKISQLFVKASGNNLFLIYTLILWASVLFSAFIDNIPYVATMLPVVSAIALQLGIEPYILYFGLLVGATLGGNLTPIGASANIAGIGILRKEGYEVKNSDFFKIGIPFTLAAVITGYLLLWFIWS